jgi:hypothetical protein
MNDCFVRARGLRGRSARLAVVWLLAVSAASLGCGERGLTPSRVITEMPHESLAEACRQHGEVVGEVMDEQWSAKEYPTTVHRTILINLKVDPEKTGELFAAVKAELLKLAEQHGAEVETSDSEGGASKSAADGGSRKYTTDDRNGVFKLGLEQGHGELNFNPTYQGSITFRPQGEDAFCLDLTIDEYQTP